MRVAILTPNPFPIGNVATNRFTTYAKSIAKKGHFVKVFVLKATEVTHSINNTQTKGIHDQVHYEYMSETTVWNTGASKISKAYHYLKGLCLAFIVLKRDKIQAVILYTNDPIYIALYGIYCKLFNIQFFIDKSEYPLIFHKPDSIYKYLNLKLFKLFDGIIVMTNELKNYYSRITNNKDKCFYLPMSIDISRFESLEKNKSNVPYFISVFGVHNRDCILDTIRAFEKFKRRNSENGLVLYLVGDYENLTDKKSIDEYISSNPTVKKFLFFTGTIVSSHIPELLINAKCLITTPRFYASGGFPTKLGEYLATGNVVVATRVYELELFLTHRENSLLAEPGNIDQIADCFQYVLDYNYECEQIGREGRKLVETVFNVDTYINDLLEFLGSEK